MLLSNIRRTACIPVLSAVALAVAACSGASSDEPAGDSGEDDIIANDGATGALAEMVLGDPDAPLTVIEYASVTCPHCATFHETIFPIIKENYIDTGKVRFVFREFPTAPAELSVVGSMLARCAADRGGVDAYYLVLGALFKTQGDPREGTGWIFSESPRAELIKIVSQAGMDEAAFDECVRRQELIDLINENVETASQKHNVRSTPSFIVGGQLRHFNSAEDFSAAIDEALEKAGK